jgi:hypothetical protein
LKISKPQKIRGERRNRAESDVYFAILISSSIHLFSRQHVLVPWLPAGREYESWAPQWRKRAESVPHTLSLSVSILYHSLQQQV